MTKSPNLAAAAIVLGALTATCFGVGRNAAQASAPARPTRTSTTITFYLNWLPNVEFAGLWAADHFGWWKKAGITMKYIPWSQGAQPETDVKTHSGINFGFQSGAALAIARSKGVPDVALYTDTQRSVFGLTVLNKSHLTKLTQLKGKKVGYQPHEIYVPETMLASIGLQAGKDYQLVPVSFDISQLTTGNVDAYLTFLTNEPIALDEQGVPNHSFPAAQYGFHFYDDVMFTTDNLVRSNPTLVRKVTEIVARGFRWAHSHPAQATNITVSKYFPASLAGKGVKAAANHRQQLAELNAFTPFSKSPDGQFRGTMSATYWRDSINTLYRYHEITSKPSPSSMFTNRFNPYR